MIDCLPVSRLINLMFFKGPSSVSDSLGLSIRCADVLTAGIFPFGLSAELPICSSRLKSSSSHKPELKFQRSGLPLAPTVIKMRTIFGEARGNDSVVTEQRRQFQQCARENVVQRINSLFECEVIFACFIDCFHGQHDAVERVFRFRAAGSG